MSFPDLRKWPADKDFVVFGGKLSQEFIVAAYRRGVFPWPDPEFPEIIWASPRERGLLEIKNFHLSKSDRRHLRKLPFRITFNQAFEKVISECASVPRVGQTGTWITDELKDAYVKLHHSALAHSVETWLGEELVGGVYGVCIDKIFSAESMFHRCDYASKAALQALVAKLSDQKLDFLDIQVVTPVMSHMGARLISRGEFLKLLHSTQDPNFQLVLK